MSTAEKNAVILEGFKGVNRLGGSDFFYLCLNDIVREMQRETETTFSSDESENNITFSEFVGRVTTSYYE